MPLFESKRKQWFFALLVGLVLFSACFVSAFYCHIPIVSDILVVVTLPFTVYVFRQATEIQTREVARPAWQIHLSTCILLMLTSGLLMLVFYKDFLRLWYHSV